MLALASAAVTNMLVVATTQDALRRALSMLSDITETHALFMRDMFREYADALLSIAAHDGCPLMEKRIALEVARSSCSCLIARAFAFARAALAIVVAAALVYRWSCPWQRARPHTAGA